MSTPIKTLISLPRSGQIVIYLALEYYHHLMNLPYSYCEYYTCCNSYPCTKSSTAYHKTHDFMLDFEITPHDKYVFLYRDNILQQIEANFRLHCMMKNQIDNTNIKFDYTNEEIVNEFKNFIITYSKYYAKMYEKYIHQNKSNILKIEYEYHISNFNECFKTILMFFNIEINEDFIEQTRLYVKPVSTHKIDITDPYYNELYDFVQSQFCLHK